MSERDVGQLHSADDLIAAVEQYGFLPFFRNEIHGFSIEELCPPELWFADDVDGPWEWKGPAARSGKCLYGKLFNKKAGFVSREWIPDFANFRRDGYDFDARWDDGLASYKDKELYEAIAGEGRMLSKRLKEALNYRKGGNTGFETCITRLQMQSYVCIADFVYMQDRYGRPYGWGVAEYATPEELFGYDLITSAYQREPQESKERMMQHLSSILPGASVQQLTKILMRKNTMSKKLVAYFSASGVTAKVAETLAEAIGADIFEIEPKVPYTEADLNWMDKKARSTIEMNDPASRPEIAVKRDNMKDYDTIFVGFPIWWYVAPTIINTFLESYDLTGKTIIPFATSGGSGIGKTNERLAPSCKGAKLMDGKVFKGSVGHQELAAWVEGLGL